MNGEKDCFRDGIRGILQKIASRVFISLCDSLDPITGTFQNHDQTHTDIADWLDLSVEQIIVDAVMPADPLRSTQRSADLSTIQR